MENTIKFGTDGWRGVIAKDFTFENLSRVSIATAEQFLEDLKTNNKIKNLAFVGYDRRFLGREFAEIVANVFLYKGLNVNLYKDDVPTPMVSFDVKKNNAVGGIVITASHNPPEFSGFKIKQSQGCSANKEYTKKIEDKLRFVEPFDVTKLKEQNYTSIGASKDYLEFVRKTIDLESIKTANHKIIVDSLYGSGGKYIESFLSGGKISVETIRGERDVNFGGINPEPMMPQLLPLSKKTIETSAFVGLATDGDADRVGAVDENGEYLNTHKLLAILLYYLVEKKKMSGDVVLTFSQSTLVKKMARHYGFKVHEVPIGFKYIADLILKGDVLIGGEEANGIGSKLHFVPERDGIFNALLLLEAFNAFNLKPSQLMKEINDKFGKFFYDRIDLHITSLDEGISFVQKIQASPPVSVNGFKVKEVQTLDGTKLLFEDESWLLFRASGTEPLLRIYSEGRSNEFVSKMLTIGQELFRQTTLCSKI